MDYRRDFAPLAQVSSSVADTVSQATAAAVQAASSAAATLSPNDGSSNSGSDPNSSDGSGSSEPSGPQNSAPATSTGLFGPERAGSTMTTITTTDSAGSQTAVATQLQASSTADAAISQGSSSSSSPAAAASTDSMRNDSGGISKGDLAAAIVVPIIIVILAIFACMVLHRRRQQRSRTFDEATGPSMTQKTRNLFQGRPGCGSRTPSSYSTMAGNGNVEAPEKAAAAPRRHPLEAIRTNPRPDAASSSRPSANTQRSAWYSEDGTSGSNPFSDANARSLASSQRSVAWSGFSGPGAGLNIQSMPSNNSNEVSRVPSPRRNSLPMAEEVDDDAVSAISDASFHEAEVVRASPSRASVIHLPGTSPPKRGDARWTTTPICL